MCEFLPGVPNRTNPDYNTPDIRTFTQGERVCILPSEVQYYRTTYPQFAENITGYGTYIGKYTGHVHNHHNIFHKIHIEGLPYEGFNLHKFKVGKVSAKQIYQYMKSAFPTRNVKTGKIYGMIPGHNLEMKNFSSKVASYLGGKRKRRHTRKGKKSRKGRKYTRKH